MAALARAAAPCPRLFLRSTTTSSSKTASSTTTPPPRRSRLGPVDVRRCHHVSSTGCGQASTWPLPPQQQQRRSFCCTLSTRHDLTKRNHYDRLQVSPAATPNDIKKSFYRLSKAHHPDANRHDPSAAHTFSLLSESYTLLSDPARRALYDRDVMARRLPAASAPPHGSYHSATYHHHAGGRPASGLSRRRGTFRGPPPSFYRNGGWGAHADKRRQAADAASSASAPHYTNYEGGGGTTAAGGHDPFTAQQAPGGHFHRDADDVPPHFDKDAHRRTHEKEDRRRWARRRRALDEEGVEFEPQASLGAHFAIVLGILGATVMVPVWYWNTVSGRKKKDY